MRASLIPKYKKTSLGDTVRFKCISDTNVTWSFDGGDLPSNVAKSKVPGSNRQSLRIRNISIHNIGTYKCEGHFRGILYENVGNLAVECKYYYF